MLRARLYDTWVLLALLGAVAPSRALTSDGAGSPPGGLDAPAGAPSPPMFHLRDGGKVAGVPRIDRIRIATRYGPLEIPPSELIQVRLAPRVDPELSRKIDEAVARLGSADLVDRDRASADLRGMGVEARQRLRAAAESSDEEVKVRARIILEEIEASLSSADRDPEEAESIDRLPEGAEDEVVAQRFTVRGRIELDRLLVATRYGDLDVSLADLESVVFPAEKSPTATISVDPDRTVPAQWLKTKVSLAKGQKFTVKASGSMTVSGYNVTSGPEGSTRYSTSSFQNFPMLALVGKVGKNGKPFLVGREHRGKAPRGGDLYLGIVPFRQVRPVTGSYRVKIDGRP